MRYRVVWLLGEWVTVKMSSFLRPSLYSVLVPILARTEDMAVRYHHFNVLECVPLYLPPFGVLGVYKGYLPLWPYGV